MNRLAFQLIIVLFSISFLSTFLYAQPELDISFNATGKVTTDLGAGSDRALELLVQPDQKIVAVGHSHSYFALTRYNPNGSLDTTFGDNGVVITNFDPNGVAQGAFAAALQPDGKIIAGGFVAIIQPGLGYFAVARYNTDGSLDQTFGNGGKVGTSIVEHVHHIRGVALAPDGKIVVAGEFHSPGSQTTQSLIVRFHTNGSLDGSFGSGGKVIDSRGFSPGDSNIPWALAVQPDGKVVTGGSYSPSVSVTGGDVTMVRYNVNGTYDTTFGSGGRLLIPSPTVSEVISAIALQPDGRIVAAGESGQNFLLVRFNADGSPDVTLDGDGRVTTAIVSASKARSVIVRPSGKIFVSGSSFTAGQGIVAAYYNPDGSLDTSFSGDGKFTLDFTDSYATAGWGMAFDDLGRVMLGGTTSENFAVVRLYTPDPFPVTVTGQCISMEGTPLRNIRVGLTGYDGQTRWANTSAFGYFQFHNVPTGQTYNLFVRGSKHYSFDSRIFGLNEAIDSLTLIGKPLEHRSNGEAKGNLEQR